jgi:hypothetical protein
MTIQETVTIVYPIPLEKGASPTSPAVAHGISVSVPLKEHVGAWGEIGFVTPLTVVKPSPYALLGGTVREDRLLVSASGAMRWTPSSDGGKSSLYAGTTLAPGLKTSFGSALIPIAISWKVGDPPIPTLSIGVKLGLVL